MKSFLRALPFTSTLALALGCTPGVVPIGEEGSSGESSSSTGPGSTVTMTTMGMTTLDTTADTTAGPVSTTSSTGDTTTEPDSSGDSTGTTEGSSGSSGSTSDASTGSTGSTSDASTGSTGGDELPDISGEFLLAMATPIDPTLPFQWIVTFDFLPVGMGGTVDVELQPLALDTGSSTSPRTFFGPPLVFPAIPVAADGSFTIDIGPMAVPAETNPIIFIDAQADMVTFDAQIIDADNVCGTADGNIVMPIFQSLTGSTFGAVRVADVLPASLPVVFPVSC